MPLPSLLSLLPSNCCGSSVRAGSSQHPGAVHAHAHVSAFEEAQVPMRTALLLRREAFAKSLHLVLKLISAVRFSGLGRVTSSDSGSLVELCRCARCSVAVPWGALERGLVTASTPACRSVGAGVPVLPLSPASCTVGAMQSLMGIPDSCWEPCVGSPHQLPRPRYKHWGDGEDHPFAVHVSESLRSWRRGLKRSRPITGSQV